VTEREMDTNKAGETLQRNDQTPDEYEGVSLKDMVLSIWGYRRAISILTLAATLLIGGTGAGIYLFQKKQDVTSLQFRLDFEGVEKNEYPNGTKFSTSDLLVSPVLNSVYDANDLKKFIALPDFRSALAVIQTNDRIRLLEYEYAPKLDDKKLTVDQRSKLEAEFLEKKKNLMSPVFNLILSGNTSSVLSIPPTLKAKVLQDILAGWAEYADRVKGANQFQIPLVSKNTLRKEDLEVQDFLVAIDMLRTANVRVVSDIAKLQKIPGAAIFRISGNGVSLQDLRFRMLDMEKFKISPLLGIIRLGGITKNDEITKVYLQHRVFELKMKEEDATSREKIYAASLNEYNQGVRSALTGVDSGGRLQPSGAASPLTANIPTTINQLGESFLSSIIKMTQENLDAKFRQDITQNIIKEGLGKVEIVSDLKYYEKLLSEQLKREKPNSQSMITDEVRSKVFDTFEQIYNSLLFSIDEVNTIYAGLSKANLNPSSTLYTVTEPTFTSQEKSLPLVKAISYAFMVWVLVEGCILVGILICNVFRKKEGVSPLLP